VQITGNKMLHFVGVQKEWQNKQHNCFAGQVECVKGEGEKPRVTRNL
jgi:hypothetical protein